MSKPASASTSAPPPSPSRSSSASPTSAKTKSTLFPLTPPLEPCLLPGSVLTPSLGAHLLTQKFCYHSTFYREEWKLRAAHGIELTRNLMCSCLDTILIGKEAHSSFQGYLQSDGLRAYQTFIARHPHLKIIPVSCLAHIPRKFYDARDDHPKVTAWILHQIACIYRIEAALRDQGAGPLERQRTRWLQTRQHSARIGRLIAYLSKQRRILPKSPLGQALAYAANQWPHLEPCFLDGQIEFDNNLTENAICPTKLGHKNWMFIGGEHTGWRSAVIYTFVEQLRRHGQDSFAWFEWVFDQLMRDPAPEDLGALLPTNWHKARTAAADQIIELPAA